MSPSFNGSILAIDVGSVNTRAVLIDQVDGIYRLIARGEGRTTIGYPIHDIRIGVERVLSDMGGASKRETLDEAGNIIQPETEDHTGVDMIVATTTAGRPMRVVIVGLTLETSIASAYKALSTVFADVVDVIHLNDHRSEEERLNVIVHNSPDLILLVGGFEDNQRPRSLQPLIDVVRLSVEIIDAEIRPQVLYAGVSHLHPDLMKSFDKLTRLHVIDNIRPSLHQENLIDVSKALGRAYTEYKSRSGGGFEWLGQQSASGILPTSHNYNIINQYFAHSRQVNAITIDIGSSVSVLASSIDGQNEMLVDTYIGLGHHALELLQQVDAKKLEAYLPFHAHENELMNYAMNKTLRPASIPINSRNLFIEHAFLLGAAQDLIARMIETRGLSKQDGGLPVQLIIGSGSAFTETGNPAYDMLLLIDAIQPIGICQIITDPYAIIPALGAMAQSNPSAAVQVLEGDNLSRLGTVISMSGEVSKHSKAMSIQITDAKGKVTKYMLMAGELLKVPISADEQVKVQISLARGGHINGKQKLSLKVQGGLAGIIFDARGRSIQYGENVTERASNIPLWIHQMTGNELFTVPERWLENLSTPKTDEIRSPESTILTPEDISRYDDDDSLNFDEFFDGLEQDDDLSIDDAVDADEDLRNLFN
ncbi:glutamate mutase L [Anaerolineales bacterium]